jgi:hypothetical protein
MQEIVRFLQEYRPLAASVDCIGWRRCMEGMVQKYALVEAELRLAIDKGTKEFVIKLLEITH